MKKLHSFCRRPSALLSHQVNNYCEPPAEQVSSTSKPNIVQDIVEDVEQSISWGSDHAGYGTPREKIIRRWLQLGRDPVVNAPTHLSKSEFKQRKEMLREDMLGTDITSDNEVHKQQSRMFWKKIIKDKALADMRQKSEGMSDVGKLTFNANEQSVMADAADNEMSRWEDDPNFVKCVKTCEGIFGTKPRNMKDFEIVLENASADQLFDFWNGAKSQLESQPHAVLGLASVTFYEGTELKDYCQRIKPLNDERREFVSVLIGDINRCGGWSVVADRLAKAYASVYDVRKKRRTRQIDENIIKAWSVMDEDQQIAFCIAERDWMEKRIATGEFDPESDDVSEAWKGEQESIRQLMSVKVKGCSFSLQTFWEQYERIIEMQREHMYVTYASKLKFAKCFQRVRNELDGNEDALYSSYVHNLQKSTFDFGNGVLIPHMSDIWCKLNWPFFGSSGYKQNTLNGRRVHMFHHGTPSQVKAIASAFYNTRPLSESIDYSSPYTFRQSHANILAEAGVQGMEDRGKAAASAEAVCEWEEDLAAVVHSVKSRMGKIRRRYQEKARSDFVHSNDSGGPISEITLFAPGGSQELHTWTPGTRATVSFQWHPQELSSPAKASASEKAALEYERRSKGRMEISLWRRKTQDDFDTEHWRIANAERICKKELMKDVSHYTLWFYQNVVHNPTCSDAESAFLHDIDLQADSSKPMIDDPRISDDNEHERWAFVAMVHDNMELKDEIAHSVTLPFAALRIDEKPLPFPAGEYRVRVRGFRYDANPQRHPARCVQRYSKPFSIVDTLSEEIKEHLSAGLSKNEWFRAEKLPALVQQLRARDFEISIDTEFALGQRITPQGEISTKHLVETLRSGEGAKNPCTHGVADDELAAERTLFKRFDEMSPGAMPDEWMSARRAVFNKAFTGAESAWWIEDDLETEEVTMRNLNEPVWYAHDKITSLSATGTFCDAPGDPLAESEIEGSGVVTQLSLKESEKELTLDKAVNALHGSLQNAHTRLSFLAHGKMAPLLEKINVCIADREHGYNGFASWGGKYLRTIHFCYKSAERNLRHKMSSIESMMREKAVERWSSPNYKFRTEKPTQEYRLGPHEALPHQDASWPR